MKKYILLLFIICSLPAYSQKLEPVDSLTSAKIFKLYLKSVFLKKTLSVKHLYNATKSHLNNFPGDIIIRYVTPGMGKWYKQLDYSLKQTDLEVPFKGFKRLYKLEIPNSTPRNDSIAGYNVYRERIRFDYRSPERKDHIMIYDYGKKFTACDWFAYDEVISNIISIDLNLLGKDNNYNKNYQCEPVRSKEKYPALFPTTEKEREAFVTSELMKNIYAYRLINSTLPDSLLKEEYISYIKDEVELFPLLDKLLPDMDCSLGLFRFHWGDYTYKNTNGKVEVYRFFYPGVDYIVHPDGTAVKDTTWNDYFKLKPQIFTVGYDTIKGLVHFISGDDFFKTRNYARDARFDTDELRKPVTKNDSLIFASVRKDYVFDRVSAYNEREWGEYPPCGLTYESEDSDYWYYTSDCNRQYTELIRDDAKLPYNDVKHTFVFKVESCKYRIRMSKLDWDNVEIIEKINCKKGNYPFPNTFIPDLTPEQLKKEEEELQRPEKEAYEKILQEKRLAEEKLKKEQEEEITKQEKKVKEQEEDQKK